MAGVKIGHSHRLRDTFALNLLDSGVLQETVFNLARPQIDKDERETLRALARPALLKRDYFKGNNWNEDVEV